MAWTYSLDYVQNVFDYYFGQFASSKFVPKHLESWKKSEKKNPEDFGQMVRLG